MDELVINWLKDLPFYVILAIILYTVLKQNRDTLKEMNSVNAVQAENQNGLISGTNIVLNGVKDAVEGLRMLINDRDRSEDTRWGELKSLIQTNMEESKERAAAAREQALAVDSISKSFTVALNNLGSRFADALRDTSRESSTTMTDELGSVGKKLDVKLENLAMDTSRLIQRNDEDKAVWAEYRMAFNAISEALTKLQDASSSSHEEIVKRLNTLERDVAEVRSRVLELQDIDEKASQELAAALRSLTAPKPAELPEATHVSNP